MKDNFVSRRALLAGTAAAGALGLSGFPSYAAEPQWKCGLSPSRAGPAHESGHG